jgi:hypothetical protein
VAKAHAPQGEAETQCDINVIQRNFTGMISSMKDVNVREFLWRFVGFCLVSWLYWALAIGFILIAPSFRELFEMFGPNLHWVTQFLMEKPWAYIFPAAIVPLVQVVFLLGVTLGGWPKATYTRAAWASVGFLLLLFASAAFALYRNIFTLGEVL